MDGNNPLTQLIELTGALTNDSGTPKITVCAIWAGSALESGTTVIFTKNWNQYLGNADPAKYFKLDDSVTGTRVVRKGDEAAFASSGDNIVTFDANGGEGTMEPQFVSEADTALSANAFTYEKHTFDSWNTEADGSGDSYTDEQEVTLTGDITLYAQWKIAQHLVTFDANGGTGTMEDQTVVETAALNENRFTYEGFYFDGWNTEADGSGTAYRDGAEVTLTEDLMLYACWFELQNEVEAGESVRQTFEGKTLTSKLNVSGDAFTDGTDQTAGVTVDNLGREVMSQSEGLRAGAEVTITMDIAAMTETESSGSSECSALLEEAQNNSEESTLDYISITVQKKVDDEAAEILAETRNVLEIAVPYSFKGKENIAVYRYHDGRSETLRELGEGENAADGTFRIDRTNKLIIIYTSRFSTYAVGYTQCYTVEGSIAYGDHTGAVNVTLKGADGTEVQDEFDMRSGVIIYRFDASNHFPQGSYDLILTWTEGYTEKTVTFPGTLEIRK